MTTARNVRHNGRATKAKAAPPRATKAKEPPRLLKVLVQPVFAVERDGELTEVPVQPLTLPASQWKTLDPEAFAKEGAAAVAAQLNGAAPSLAERES